MGELHFLSLSLLLVHTHTVCNCSPFSSVNPMLLHPLTTFGKILTVPLNPIVEALSFNAAGTINLMMTRKVYSGEKFKKL